MIETLKKIYNWLEDDISKEIYLNRLNYLVSGDLHFIAEMGEKHCEDLCRREFPNYIEINPKDEIVLYGCGYFGKLFIKEENADNKYNTNLYNIKYICDKNETVQKNGYDSYVVKSPEYLFKNYNGEQVIITSKDFFEEIKNNCLKHGIPRDKIYTYYKKASKQQYFIEDFIKLNKREIFIDAGSCDLRTSHTLKQLCPDSMCYAFEPDPQCYEKCESFINNFPEKYNNIRLFPYGTWNCKTTLYFSATNDGSSHITSEGECKINTITIDEAVSEPVTFIKMDVEGAELKSLEGAKNTIQKYKPKLAICIYHKSEDMYEIPLYMKSLVPEYKLYVRHYSNYYGETVLYAII